MWGSWFNILLLIILAFPLTNADGQEIYGYADSPPASTSFAPVSNVVVQVKISLINFTRITHIGLYADGITNIRGMIYTVKGNNQGDLLAYTNAFTSTLGLNNLPLASPIVLPPGEYWIGINFENSINIGHDNFVSGNITYFHFNLDFSDPIPNTGTGQGGGAIYITPAIYAIGFVVSASMLESPIPTLSQWGLIIFGLLVLNLGLVFVYKKQLITAEASVPATYIPFNRTAFSKYFIIVLSIIGVAFIIAMTLFGYELMTFDVLGSVLTAGLIAYLIQLLNA